MSRMMLVTAGAVIALTIPALAHCSEHNQEATTKMVMEMIVDLGGHDAVEKNSGKTMRCTFGGSRKVSVVRQARTTTLTGDYRNCRERGSTRDGLYEIVLDGDEIVSTTSKRTINGELFDAAKQGGAAKVRELIKAGADLNYTESLPTTDGGAIEGMTPLMAATMAGSLETVKVLVAGGAWVNYLNGMVLNAFWIAAHNGNLEIVKYLAKHGAYINNSNREDVTPLMAAAMNGHSGVVKFLIGAKAKINAVHKEGDSALMFALAGKHTEIARFLIDAGADINIRNKYGVTALIIAAAEGNEEIARTLVAKKADTAAMSTDGKTALDVARAKGLTGIVNLLEKAAN